jgi:hypothetical protein
LVLKKLEELGYKPKKSAEKKDNINETADILKNIEDSEIKQQILDLLLEALSEPDPREILVYGMYVKKCFSPVVRSTRKDSIEKTLKLLIDSIGK